MITEKHTRTRPSWNDDHSANWPRLWFSALERVVRPFRTWPSKNEHSRACTNGHEHVRSSMRLADTTLPSWFEGCRVTTKSRNTILSGTKAIAVIFFSFVLDREIYHRLWSSGETRARSFASLHSRSSSEREFRFFFLSPWIAMNLNRSEKYFRNKQQGVSLKVRTRNLLDRHRYPFSRIFLPSSCRERKLAFRHRWNAYRKQ